MTKAIGRLEHRDRDLRPASYRYEAARAACKQLDTTIGHEHGLTERNTARRHVYIMKGNAGLERPIGGRHKNAREIAGMRRRLQVVAKRAQLKQRLPDVLVVSLQEQL